MTAGRSGAADRRESRESFKGIALRSLSAAGEAIAQLASGLNTALLAILLLLWMTLIEPPPTSFPLVNGAGVLSR
ncbi:hypothetical protein ACFWBS_58100 [Streptomyces mirabilis]|uniref:hypothetical protein n=1 Tax=Streptomyces mirabilis TaxID=68239 RepID=UPI003667CD12